MNIKTTGMMDKFMPWYYETKELVQEGFLPHSALPDFLPSDNGDEGAEEVVAAQVVQEVTPSEETIIEQVDTQKPKMKLSGAAKSIGIIGGIALLAKFFR